MTNTLNTVFEHTLPIRYHELDAHGNASPVTLLNYLQDSAGLHAAQLGVAVSDLHKKGLTWVLSRIHLIVSRYPRAKEHVTIRTWPASRSGLFSCREFELTGTDGTDCGRATTSWAVIRVASHRPVRLEGNLPEYPLIPHRAINDDFASLPDFPGGAASECSFRVLRSDLDSNHHVNNAVFAGWALETVPDEIAAGVMTELEISFRAEALYGDTVISRCAVTEPGICLHQIINKQDSKELARLRTRWTTMQGFPQNDTTTSGGQHA